jgi:catechol 2,3-dioxygenase-like lactoylglutathione lyase family enzyme
MKAIEIISIPVSDQQRSKAFYLQLGFVVVAEAAFDNQTWVQLGLPGDGASITLVTWFPKMPAGCVQGLVIKTESVEADKAELTAKGIESGAIDHTPWGKFLTVTDPDGNTLSFREG